MKPRAGDRSGDGTCFRFLLCSRCPFRFGGESRVAKAGSGIHTHRQSGLLLSLFGPPSPIWQHTRWSGPQFGVLDLSVNLRYVLEGLAPWRGLCEHTM